MRNKSYYWDLWCVICLVFLSNFSFSHDVQFNKAALYEEEELLSIFLHTKSYSLVEQAGVIDENLFQINGCSIASMSKKNTVDGVLLGYNLECQQPAQTVDFSVLMKLLPNFSFIFEKFDKHHLKQRQLVSIGNPKIQLNRSQNSTILDYVRLGADHISSGYDHLVFLLALSLLLGWTALLFWAVLGFTLGHGLSITLASLQIVEVHASLVEIVIGLSIVVLAIEALYRGRSQKKVYGLTALLVMFLLFTPYWLSAVGLGLVLFGYFNLKARSDRAMKVAIACMTVIFGLYHGLGFSQLLIAQNFEISELWQPIIGFNIGVELGQIIAIVLMFAFAEFALKFIPAKWHVLCREVTACLALTCGIYWLCARTLAQFVF